MGRQAFVGECYPLFSDANSNNISDPEGLCQKLHYIRSNGATTIRIQSFYKSSIRDADLISAPSLKLIRTIASGKPSSSKST